MPGLTQKLTLSEKIIQAFRNAWYEVKDEVITSDEVKELVNKVYEYFGKMEDKSHYFQTTADQNGIGIEFLKELKVQCNESEIQILRSFVNFSRIETAKTSGQTELKLDERQLIQTQEEFIKIMDEKRLWGGWQLALEDGSLSGMENAESYQEQKDTAESYIERFPKEAEEIMKKLEKSKNSKPKSESKPIEKEEKPVKKMEREQEKISWKSLPQTSQTKNVLENGKEAVILSADIFSSGKVEKKAGNDGNEFLIEKCSILIEIEQNGVIAKEYYGGCSRFIDEQGNAGPVSFMKPSKFTKGKKPFTLKLYEKYLEFTKKQESDAELYHLMEFLNTKPKVIVKVVEVDNPSNGTTVDKNFIESFIK